MAARRNSKPKKPLYKRFWFWLIIVSLLYAARGGGEAKDAEPSPEAAVLAEAPSRSALSLISTPEPTAEPTPEPTPTPVPVNTYVLNTNTWKFHKPSCSSVSEIKEKNKAVVESTREDLIAQGYEPCKKCKP